MKLIIFDLGGVCLSNHWGKKERQAFSRDFGLDYNNLEEYHLKNVKKANTGKISEVEYFDGLFSAQNKELQTKKAIDYTRSKNYAFQDVLRLILLLKQNYRIIALTNEMKEAANFRIKKFDLIKYFEKVFISAEIGYEKPDKEIYDYVLKEININPEEVIFIDNRLENLETAEVLGMKTVHFISLNQLKEDLEILGVNTN